MTEYRRRDRDYEPRRGGGFGGLFVRLVLGLVILGALAAAALVYLGKSEEGVVEDMASGLDVVAERLEQGDREGAAEKLRTLKAKLEKAGPASHELSAKAKDALSRIKDKSGDLYEKAKDLVKDAGKDETPADGAAGEPPQITPGTE